jgi:hypothetical protein
MSDWLLINVETVSSVPLESLILKNNSMETIEQDAFSYFNFLRKLEISYEKKLNKTDLNRSFKSLNVTNLEVLRFEQNNWTTLPRHMFQHLSGANNDSSGTDETLLKVSLVIYGKWHSTSCKIKVPGGSLGI